MKNAEEPRKLEGSQLFDDQGHNRTEYSCAHSLPQSQQHVESEIRPKYENAQNESDVIYINKRFPECGW